MPSKVERGLAVPFLRAWRFYAVLSQSDLSERSGVSRPTIARVESGERMSFANIHKVAAALGITVQQLLHEDPSKSKVE